MDGKEAIITKIISDAEADAKVAVSDAQKRVAEMIAETEKKTVREFEEAEKRLDESAKNVLSRRETVARLDANKQLLEAKQSVLDAVFSNALKKLERLGEKEYCALVENSLENYAETGDEVVISKDCAFVTQISALKVFADKKLILSKKRGDFSGGVMLLGKKCDVNLTFEALIAADREENESVISGELFG